jgi:flagellar hook assembly protein FlgD
LTEATTDVSPVIPTLAAQLGVAPNPSRGTVALRFRLPAAGNGEFSMYDLRGRRVRVLARGSFPAGDQGLSWDGRDASGRRVAPGIYFAVVRVGEMKIVGRVLRLD